MRKFGAGEAVPTVAVKHPDTPGAVMRVNQTDYEADPKRWQRWEGPLPASAPAPGSDTPPPQASGLGGAVSSEKTGPEGGVTEAETRESVRDLVKKSLEPMSYADLKAQAKAEGIELAGNPSKEKLLEALADKLAAEK